RRQAIVNAMVIPRKALMTKPRDADRMSALLASLAFAVPTIPTEIAAARVFQLAAAFGADADHRGHDCAHHVLRSECGVRSLLSQCARGVGMALQAAVGDHDAFGHGLFG